MPRTIKDADECLSNIRGSSTFLKFIGNVRTCNRKQSAELAAIEIRNSNVSRELESVLAEFFRTLARLSEREESEEERVRAGYVSRNKHLPASVSSASDEGGSTGFPGARNFLPSFLPACTRVRVYVRVCVRAPFVSLRFLFSNFSPTTAGVKSLTDAFAYSARAGARHSSINFFPGRLSFSSES